MSHSTKDILYILTFTVVIILLGLVPPILSPKISLYITAQSMGALLAGGILGSRRGALSVIVFLLLVALQLPIVAGGSGGLGMLTGQTGGFFIGWVLAAYVTGLMIKHFWNRLNFVIASLIMALGGIVVIYTPGIIWIGMTGNTSVVEAIKLTSVYIPGDLVKSIVCGIIILLVRERFAHIAPIAEDNHENHTH